MYREIRCLPSIAALLKPLVVCWTFKIASDEMGFNVSDSSPVSGPKFLSADGRHGPARPLCSRTLAARPQLDEVHGGSLPQL